MLGKTNSPEFGLVGTCENSLGEPGRNPWNTDRVPGGSSGGAAAAMAASLCALATGGDGGGSIRIPASFCGVYGIKPSQGRVSVYSGLEGPQSANTFSQQGPLSRTVRDSALMLKVLAGHDRRDPLSLREEPPDFMAAVDRDISGLRIAWSPDYGFAAVDSEVLEATTSATREFEQMGCSVEEPDFVIDSPYDAYGPIYESNAYNSYSGYLDEYGDRMAGFTRQFIEWGSKVSVADYARAQGLIVALKAQMADLFEEYDLLLSPTTSVTAIPVDEFPEGVRGQSGLSAQVLRLPSVHLPDQRHRPSGGQHPGRILVRGDADRPPHRRKAGGRGDGAGGVGRLRAGEAVDGPEAPGLLIGRQTGEPPS